MCSLQHTTLQTEKSAYYIPVYQVSYFQLQWFSSNCRYRKANNCVRKSDFNTSSLSVQRVFTTQSSKMSQSLCHFHLRSVHDSHISWYMFLFSFPPQTFLWTPCFDEDRAYPGIMTTHILKMCELVCICLGKDKYAIEIGLLSQQAAALYQTNCLWDLNSSSGR